MFIYFYLKTHKTKNSNMLNSRIKYNNKFNNDITYHKNLYFYSRVGHFLFLYKPNHNDYCKEKET